MGAQTSALKTRIGSADRQSQKRPSDDASEKRPSSSEHRSSGSSWKVSKTRFGFKDKHSSGAGNGNGNGTSSSGGSVGMGGELSPPQRPESTQLNVQRWPGPDQETATAAEAPAEIILPAPETVRLYLPSIDR